MSGRSCARSHEFEDKSFEIPAKTGTVELSTNQIVAHPSGDCTEIETGQFRQAGLSAFVWLVFLLVFREVC